MTDMLEVPITRLRQLTDELNQQRTRADAAEADLATARDTIATRDDAITYLEAELRQAHRLTAPYRQLAEAAREWRHQFAPGPLRRGGFPRRDALITAIDNTLTAEDPPEPEQVAARPGCSCRASGPGPQSDSQRAGVYRAALVQLTRELLDSVAENDRLRGQLRDAHNDLLEVRGILSPNGGERVVPPGVSMVPAVAPAVRWLVDELHQARAEVEREVDVHGAVLDALPKEPALGRMKLTEAVRQVVTERLASRTAVALLRVELGTTRGQLAMAQEMGDTARAELSAARTRVAWQATLAAQLRLLVAAVERGGPVVTVARHSRELLAALDAETPPAAVRTHDEIRAQVLYAGLPQLPVEPGTVDDEVTRRG